jgi:hypothetical protein
MLVNLSSSFGQVPQSMFNEPKEGVVRSHYGSIDVCLTSPRIENSGFFHVLRV